MNSTPVIALLAFDLVLFLLATVRLDHWADRRTWLLVSVLFFCSGMPALIYQVVWQRALFAIYGVNAESVAVVVSAFMLGLGLGCLAGGWLSARFPERGILLFGVMELGTAAFGLSSLRIFHWAAVYTAGASLLHTVVFSLTLLIVPTMLMGATLPLLVEHLVRRSGRVGYSVALLYFVNTLGSAVACCLCATFLLRDFGQTGSVSSAALLNTIVGATAYLLGSRQKSTIQQSAAPSSAPRPVSERAVLPLGIAATIVGVSGFLALGFEMVWFRVFVLASSDRAPAFALLLSTYLAGVAAGAYVSERLTEGRGSDTVLPVVGLLMLIAGAFSLYLPPLVAALTSWNVPFLASAPAFFLVAGLLGAALPLICRLAVSPGDQAGRGVSLVYVSNIVGATAGSLVIGFFLMQRFGLEQVSLQLGGATVVVGGGVILFAWRKLRSRSVWAWAAMAVGLLSLPLAPRFYPRLFDRLILGARPEAREPFAHVVENRNGVISVTSRGTVFGSGVYDGYFNVDPTNDENWISRAYAVSAFHPSPTKILVIGLSSGSWCQILVHHPQANSLDVVEINPGYLQLIPQYPMVRSLLKNPKVHIWIDDGRRWLLAHPQARYDLIVSNTSFYWRDHITHLLSVEFLQIVRSHLNPGGIFYYNTTESDDVVATGLRVFPYALRVINFLAVSNSPIEINKGRWMDVLRQYKIDDAPVLNVNDPASQHVLSYYSALADAANFPPVLMGMEKTKSLRARLQHRLIVTDDNMGWEWRGGVVIPWR
jgi:predicted membrane-bound spermidine synthase